MSATKRLVGRRKNKAVSALPSVETRPTIFRDDAQTFRPEKPGPIFCQGVDPNAFAAKQGNKLRGFSSRSEKWISYQETFDIPSQVGRQTEFEMADPRLTVEEVRQARRAKRMRRVAK